MSPRVLFYVQHLVGVGHQRRSAAIARALAGRGARVCYVSGGLPVPGLALDGCRFEQLAPARSLDMRYHTLVDADGRAVDDGWKARRRDRLLAIADAFGPHALITETYPFGRRLLRFELEPLVARARERGVLCASSVRDIVEHRRNPERYERMARAVERDFDLVLVHADPALVPFEDSFPLAARIRERLRYTGYVSERAPLEERVSRPGGPVVVSAGGGFFGERLLATALDAQPLTRVAPRRWQVLVGPNLDEARFRRLRGRAPAGVTVERNRADFHALLDACSVSVSQGGYNTIVDLLASRVPAVVVPYEDDREREQAVRARHLAARGLVHVVEHLALDAPGLARAIDDVAAGDGMPATHLALDGARVTAGVVLEALSPRIHQPTTRNEQRR